MCFVCCIISLTSCHNELQEIDDSSRKIEYKGYICKEETLSQNSNGVYLCLVMDVGFEYNYMLNFCEANYIIACDNGFNLNITEELQITTILIDVLSYYIVSLKTDTTEFLSFEEGYENLKIDLME